MDSIDISRGCQEIIKDSTILDSLPSELLEIICLQDSTKFLDALATASLIPELTLRFFGRFENVFADTCARWISSPVYKTDAVFESFARVLRFAPHLCVFLEKYLQQRTPLSPLDGKRPPSVSIPYLTKGSQDDITLLPTIQLQRLLLAALRLLNFNERIYSQLISGSKIQSLLQHPNRPIRYLAIRIFCKLLSTSDAKLETMIREHVGREEVIGDFDGFDVDYGFLSLYEDNYTEALYEMRKSLQESNIESKPFYPKRLSPLVARFEDVLLPRPGAVPSKQSTMVLTTTTSRNMKVFAKKLLSEAPILIYGLSGSGKTSLVNHFARELGKESSMVTLHLNEQTDAKMLIGMYGTSSTPGLFTWRPGVLTTAVREGRWVFIEDLDRAPTEVVSFILPLIERGELLIPNRGEVLRATSGFRLIASIRTSLNVSGQEILPTMHMLGARLWNRVPVSMPSRDEFMEIINGIYPLLHKFLPGVVAVYERLFTLSQKPIFASRNRSSTGRPISPRDLLKWCRRLDATLKEAGSETGEEPISEATKDKMFLDAADCFASSLQAEDARKLVITCIAEEMHIPLQRVEHFLGAYSPTYVDTEECLRIGRARISKRRASSRIGKPSKLVRPFANTAHAKRLLEQVGIALRMAEPVLLVGETGIGKTAVVQELADSLGFKLAVVNLSHQSEVGDLLGGFKPVNVKSLAIPLKEEFDDLFASTGISASRNQKYLEQLGRCVARCQWSKASKLWHEAPRMFDRILSDLTTAKAAKSKENSEQPMKRRKTDSRLHSLLELKPRWIRFAERLDLFDMQLSAGSKGFAFSFVEGNIVKAVRNGEWVLLDEVNLASPDTLESIADLLQSGPGAAPSILLSETGEIERVRAHPDFRIFGAMNPATDVGKRDLPIGLRSRFTEIYVESPDRDLNDLLSVVKVYLKGTGSNDERAAHDIARLYINTKRLADEKRLVDGANQVPHYSLRTLTRVLGYVTEVAPSYGLRRAMYEGYAMGFLTLLDRASESMLTPLINHHLLDSHGNPQALLAQTPRRPEDGRQYVRFVNKKKDRQYWILQGHETPQQQPHYIITPFVERNMLNLVRATSTRRFPVLVQGPTSSGKTSMIEYLAKFSGNKFVRINNHEHTDLQEYLGTYVSGADGQLRFQEGLLVQALREGHWIVLDELNLAPSDVLEALNRLLDDNRELLIPETQDIVRPHQNFMLFATQNPPGLYGGRKTLSRAFRNRFLELHFDDIPEDELEFILENRSQKVSPSDCRRVVTVYKELSRLRQSNRLFEQKDSFATLRDLFRWTLRDADSREQLAVNGYMLLAERVRKPEERIAVKEVIEKVFKVKLDPDSIYAPASSPEIQLYNSTVNKNGVVWTKAMRRLFVLVAHALRNNEPVLLVGETGCGKTTVCQMLAESFGRQLHIVNAHQNTETGDLIGAQRPIRNRAASTKQLEYDLRSVLRSHADHEISIAMDLDSLYIRYQELPDEARAAIPLELHERILAGQVRVKALFEWSDGSLVQAMKEAQFFLLDEISLADDSVLERLNSVLESQRTLLLAEKGVQDSFVQAADGFQFFATMNPGGDYGKRELSPALRNRFTEIWVPPLSDREDLLQIVNSKIAPQMIHNAEAIIDFARWFGHAYRSSEAQSVSVRDILAWITFINSSSSNHPYFAILHGAATTFIDTLGANPAALLAIDTESIFNERKICIQQLSTFIGHDLMPIYASPVQIKNTSETLCFGGFSVKKSKGAGSDLGFAFEAPTTKLNAMRVTRALQVQKPILIEGSPGVGKTTLIAALARAIGKPLTRINLSEQTDLMDLFGSDIPIDGAEAGSFAWRDAAFLRAMQTGDWVLLDEMNLASQSVLEGLNACLDHRGEVYISELDQTFIRHPNFRVFAAQNPHHHGGGRKGLPGSFVNRFTVVYADHFRDDDLMLICKHNFPAVSHQIMSDIIHFVSSLEREVIHRRKFGSQGGPWEFNLRDSLRWLQLIDSSTLLLAAAGPADFLNIVFRQRFRTAEDREEVEKLFEQAFRQNIPYRHYFHNLSAENYQAGIAYMSRQPLMRKLPFPDADVTTRLPELESIMLCINQNLPCLLVGPSGSGKTTLIQHIAAASGAELVVFPLNSEIDTMDLVGGFEQIDPYRAGNELLSRLCAFLECHIVSLMPEFVPGEAIEIIQTCKIVHEDPAQGLADLYGRLANLQEKTKLTGLDNFLSACQACADESRSINSARFEWVDGVLIKALEEGKWLVLDNANLCNSSVLDRLNPLLEPDGFLTINEHCGPTGEPKVVKPHKNFRIFLTMDPRYGELSRAMRNRAIEIFVGASHESKTETISTRSHPEASLERYKNIVRTIKSINCSDEAGALVGVALDHLERDETYPLERFMESLQKGIVKFDNPEALQKIHQYLKIRVSGETKALRVEISELYGLAGKATGLPQSFSDAQIFHPLQNSPLVPMLELFSSSGHAYWLGALLDLHLEIAAAYDAQQAQLKALSSRKPSQMNRLQRSMVRNRVPAVAGDSTTGTNDFLTEGIHALRTHLYGAVSDPSNWMDHKGALRDVMQVLWETYRLTSNSKFDEATFQAHLAISIDVISSMSSTTKFANYAPRHRQKAPSQIASQRIGQVFVSLLMKHFGSGFKLSTGLSMERLWHHFRPKPISSMHTLHTLIDMEDLAARFDKLKWKLSISISELSRIMSLLAKAYRLMLASEVDGEPLIQALTAEITSLEDGLSNQIVVSEPFFLTNFESLRQYEALQSIQTSEDKDEIVLLSNISTVSLMRLAGASHSSMNLQNIDYLWGQMEALLPIHDSFSASLLHKFNHIAEVTLGSLSLLEAELPVLGHFVAKNSVMLCQNQVLNLNENLSKIITGVVESHGMAISSQFRQWANSVGGSDGDMRTEDSEVELNRATGLHKYDGPNVGVPEHFRDVLRDHFRPSLSAISAAKIQPQDQLGLSSLAWIHFAIGAIILYVPDRPFDPDSRQRLERQRHETLKQSIERKILALRKFEHIFTGQESNLRCLLLEAELLELGEPAEVLHEVVRPDVSELDQLQGEFNNLLGAVLQIKPHEIVSTRVWPNKEVKIQSLKILQNNVTQIIRRLSERFRAYNDMTVPLIGMLRCLQIGLYLASVASENVSQNTVTTNALSKITPFLGGGPFLEDIDNLENPLDVLANIAVFASVEGLGSLRPTQQQLLVDHLHSCYELWSKKLDTDREEAESNAGLYRFRGGAEDEEEDDQREFKDIFPSYEDDSPGTAKGTPSDKSLRDKSIQLADLHAKIFLGSSSPVEDIMCLICEVSQRAGMLNDSTSFVIGNMTAAFLPGTLLRINGQIEKLSSLSASTDSYNFYTDSNLLEARKLVELVHQIQNRFRELQKVDEIAHMQPLEDVLVSCKELLLFRHIEPLAKVITKIEKIHDFLHEWQFGGWASRANSVLTLYDNLTSTIVRWRRLELSTWSRLFDMESRKCDDDAKSWWFIAYEVIIAIPLTIAKSEVDIRSYAQKLIEDLETYFATAIQGQFIPRLKLVNQLQRHLELLSSEYPLLSLVSSSLANFIDIYSRYKDPVLESLKKSRGLLENAMRDVLLLASWKDTNIVALRDSARRSHHKLFKLVRKYRAVLGQPMDHIMQNGLPDEPVESIDYFAHIPKRIPPLVDGAAIKLCESHVLHWQNKSQRLLNISKTVSLMEYACQIPAAAIDGAQYLESFLTNIVISVAELQKATPSILTNENKTIVKHLKTRKRKLLADTLKELRQMGVKHNLGTADLAKQSSFSEVVSTTGYIQRTSILSSEGMSYYFHKTIDLLPRTRVAIRQHSSDLSSAEVARSMGLLEGLFHASLKQRNILSASICASGILVQQVQMAQALWAPGMYEVRNLDTKSTITSTLAWLPNILRVGLELIQAYEKLGNTKSENVRNTLASYAETFDSLGRVSLSLPLLPAGICSTAHADLIRRTEDSTQSLLVDLTEAAQQHPNLEFTLQQIHYWAVTKSHPILAESDKYDILALDSKLSSICDSILVSIEKTKKSLAKIPNSTDDSAWFIKYDNCIADAISKLHVTTIIAQINIAFEILKGINFDDRHNGKLAAAVFAVVIPVFRQYLNIVEKILEIYARLHIATCKMIYVLAKTFNQIATHGFCTPSEKSAAEDGKTNKLEGGTGLGSGEGVEDISKDIQDDEDLSELAQEPNQGEQEDMEDEKDAVDIADEDIDGDIGDSEGKEEGDDENGEKERDGDEIDEEAGSVDDLDPNAVDEKMWDGEVEKAQKEQESDQSRGKAAKDEQLPGHGNDKQVAEGEEGEDQEEEAGAEQNEEVEQEEAEKHDPNAHHDGEVLDLPEDMQLSGENGDSSVSCSDDGMDELSDIHDDDDNFEEQSDDRIPDVVDPDVEENQVGELHLDDLDLEMDMDERVRDTEDVGEKNPEDAEPEPETENSDGLLQDHSDDAMAEPNDGIPSGTQGLGEEQGENQPDDGSKTQSKAQREAGGRSGASPEQKDMTDGEGENKRQTGGDMPQGQEEETKAVKEAQPYRKLGDALDRWHRQQNRIMEALENQEQTKEEKTETDAGNAEYQHLQDNEAQADTQALGTAAEDQAHALDESLAINSETKDLPDTFQPDEAESEYLEEDEVMGIEQPEEHWERAPPQDYEGRASAIIRQANIDRDYNLNDNRSQDAGVEEEIKEVDVQLSGTHINDRAGLTTSRSLSSARQLWNHYESRTRDLSLSLTEQLRLILAPTLATKMRGDFRTGKRLNIKRIIPYIASQYKRDKIWMRRSVPSKRSYQVMLAVDDSKSMGESGSDSLAFETLVMVSRSLSMLEVGEICVVGFGENVRVAHDFETPFTVEAGAQVFQNFGFGQNRTDITELVRESIELFRGARAKASNNPADLWQLELIISDGVCDSSEHEPIGRLLREAIEERIMIVFVIVDDLKNKKSGESVMDLKEAKFIKDEDTGLSNVKIERYLDTFPFQYYLVVSDVTELPGVLAALLRQWFAEVIDSSR